MWAELRTKTDVIRSHWWTFLLSLAMGLAGGFVAAGALYSERVEMVEAANDFLRDRIDSGQAQNAERLSPAVPLGTIGWWALGVVALVAVVSLLWASGTAAWRRRKSGKAPTNSLASPSKPPAAANAPQPAPDDVLAFLASETAAVSARPHVQISSAIVDINRLASRGNQVRAMVGIANCTASDLTQCSLQIHSIQTGRLLTPIKALIQRGKDRRTHYPIGAKTTANAIVGYRNYDVAPDEPFLINGVRQYLNALSEDAPVTLSDNTTHYLNLIADSGAGVVTRAVLELKIGEYEELQVKLLGQSSWRAPS